VIQVAIVIFDRFSREVVTSGGHSRNFSRGVGWRDKEAGGCGRQHPSTLQWFKTYYFCIINNISVRLNYNFRKNLYVLNILFLLFNDK